MFPLAMFHYPGTEVASQLF